MTPDETRAFALRLMQEVWEPFGHEAVERFYHPDAVGHHRGQTISRRDIVQRLRWDLENFSNPRYDIRQLVAEADAFAIRFLFTCVLTRTGETFVTEVIYFYKLRDGKVAEFWLLSDANFDYKQSPFA